jgi:Ca2+/Na+ antiporter
VNNIILFYLAVLILSANGVVVPLIVWLVSTGMVLATFYMAYRSYKAHERMENVENEIIQALQNDFDVVKVKKGRKSGKQK